MRKEGAHFMLACTGFTILFTDIWWQLFAELLKSWFKRALRGPRPNPSDSFCYSR